MILIPNGSKIIASQNIANIAWWVNKVRPNGDWDYKRGDNKLTYENFGNFNYGATGAALGFSRGDLLRGAGFAQEFLHGAYDPSDGHFWGDSPFGDNRNDQYWIEQGINYYFQQLSKNNNTCN